MLSLFSDIVERFLEIFMDDFSIYGDSFDQCLNHNADCYTRQRKLFPPSRVTEGSENRYRHQGQNSSRYKRINVQIMQLLKSAWFALPIKARFSDIHTLHWGMDKPKEENTKKKKRKNRRKEIHSMKPSKLRLLFHYKFHRKEESSPNHYSIVFKD